MKSIINQTIPLLITVVLILTGCSTTKTQSNTESHPAANNAMYFPPLPEGITSFGAAVDDGYLYIFGGYTGKRHDYCIEKVRGTFYRIKLDNDGQGQSWEALPGSEPAQGTAIVAHGHYIYRIGGMAAKNHEGQPQDLVSQDIFERYDIQKKVWEQLNPLPEGRSTHDAVIVGDKLYVGGGWDLNGDPFKDDNSAKWHDTLLVADLSQDNPQWQSIPQPFKRRALAMAVAGSKIYFIGGMDSDNEPSRAVDVYDTTTGTWSKGPDLPHSMMDGFGFAAVGADNSIYASGFSGELLRLSADGSRWEVIAKLKEPRFFHRLILLDEKHLIAVGGEGKQGKLQDIEVLSISP
ncbi:MAG TPA: kelch repeat-containing protein [Pseudomonadales bacterium]|nr:kelch repeat-containing protein [Pseudomonadales bacterium]